MDKKKEQEANGLVDKFVRNHLSKNSKETISKEDKEFFVKFVENKKDLISNLDKYKKRAFEGGKVSQMKGIGGFSQTTFDFDTFNGFANLRNSSRNLSQNNSILKKFLEMCETNIVGPNGFDIQINGQDANGKLDIQGNRAVKNGWYEWCNSEWCDITGKLTFKEIQRVCARTIAEQGEILIRIVRSRATQENPWGFSLQLLDSYRLDYKYNETLGNGNIVKMGVEVNKYGRPVAYHLKINDTAESLYNSTYDALQRERVEAKDILHPFEVISAEQTRGIPWAYAVLSIIDDLEDFLRACLIAAKIGASSSIYLERTIQTDSNSIESVADYNDAWGNFEMEVSPGDIRVLPAGMQMKAFQAQYPSSNFTPYVQIMLKLIASGLGISYFTLANSLEGVNFSSSRTGLLEERDNWMKKQDLFITKIINPIYNDWLKTSLLNKAIKFPNGSVMNAVKYDKFRSVKIVGKRWTWVDPVKDAQATILAVKNGLMSKTEALSALGRDYEQILIDKKAEMELEKIYGISFDYTDLKGKTDIEVEEDSQTQEEDGQQEE